MIFVIKFNENNTHCSYNRELIIIIIIETAVNRFPKKTIIIKEGE
jgi:hypothetical protein